MSDVPKPARRPSAAVAWTRRAREHRVLGGLKAGASVAALAEREGVSVRRMRVIVNGLLAAHPDLEPADALAQLRSRRLDEAFEMAHNAMLRGSPNASGQLLHILREIGRNAEPKGSKKTDGSANSES